MQLGVLSVLGRIEAQTGFCYVAELPRDVPQGDDLVDPRRSGLRLFEDDREIGPAHANHDAIRALGGGRFSHWHTMLYFSASDGSDPRLNGRTYRYLWTACKESSCARSLREALEMCDDTLDLETRYSLAERLFAALVPGEHVGEHSRSMFRDAEFRQDYERFDRTNYRSFDRKFALRGFAERAATLPGDFVECGVYKGASAYLLSKVIRSRAPWKRLHLFDSFAGLSSPGPHDGSYWRKGALAASLSEVQRNLAEFCDFIALYPGWIPERFCDVADRRFALVHIDVDLFDPTRSCLEFFGPRLVPGGVIVCDDYGFETCPGARRAVDEFAAAAATPVVHLPTGQGVLFARSE